MKISHPKVILKINKNFDIEIGTHFLNNKIGNYDFGKDRIISEHPEFSKWRKLPEKEIFKKVKPYVNSYYKEQEKELNDSVVSIQKIWDEIEDSYFTELSKVFGRLDFYKPKKISASLSIFKCGVIDDNMKNFQIWFKTENEPNEVRRHIAHEVLHFYYYAYLQTHHFDKLKDNWDLAEIFNRIILNLPQFLNLTKQKEIGYTQHTRLLPKYQKTWGHSSSIDQYLEILQKGEEKDEKHH
ncbi:MAG: hypothetical protein NT098_02210 [Candidatus Parcubacteria bacterium]|nr:hypothetical protein [Candidatus Parcubacteria bacterium]